MLRFDNVPELISIVFAQLGGDQGVELEFKPTQSFYRERLNRTYRDEVLNTHVFEMLNVVRETTQNWIREYNEEGPHDSLKDLTPWDCLTKHPEFENSCLWCN